MTSQFNQQGVAFGIAWVLVCVAALAFIHGARGNGDGLE